MKLTQSMSNMSNALQCQAVGGLNTSRQHKLSAQIFHVWGLTNSILSHSDAGCAPTTICQPVILEALTGTKKKPPTVKGMCDWRNPMGSLAALSAFKRDCGTTSIGTSSYYPQTMMQQPADVRSASCHESEDSLNFRATCIRAQDFESFSHSLPLPVSNDLTY